LGQPCPPPRDTRRAYCGIALRWDEDKAAKTRQAVVLDVCLSLPSVHLTPRQGRQRGAHLGRKWHRQACWRIHAPGLWEDPRPGGAGVWLLPHSAACMAQKKADPSPVPLMGRPAETICIPLCWPAAPSPSRVHTYSGGPRLPRRACGPGQPLGASAGAAFCAGPGKRPHPVLCEGCPLPPQRNCRFLGRGQLAMAHPLPIPLLPLSGAVPCPRHQDRGYPGPLGPHQGRQ
jgi:hypothetical protein